MKCILHVFLARVGSQRMVPLETNRNKPKTVIGHQRRLLKRHVEKQISTLFISTLNHPFRCRILSIRPLPSYQEFVSACPEDQIIWNN